MKRKKKRASTKICDPAACHHCTYIGEGDFMCDNHPDEAVVLVFGDVDTHANHDEMPPMCLFDAGSTELFTLVTLFYINRLAVSN